MNNRALNDLAIAACLTLGMAIEAVRRPIKSIYVDYKYRKVHKEIRDKYLRKP